MLVEGELSPDRETGGPRLWTGQDGQLRSNYEVRAFRVQFLGGGNGGSGQGQHYDDRSPAEQAIDEGEIPF